MAEPNPKPQPLPRPIVEQIVVEKGLGSSKVEKR
jgi:hypothetical protein